MKGTESRLKGRLHGFRRKIVFRYAKTIFSTKNGKKQILRWWGKIPNSPEYVFRGRKNLHPQVQLPTSGSWNMGLRKLVWIHTGPLSSRCSACFRLRLISGNLCPRNLPPKGVCGCVKNDGFQEALSFWSRFFLKMGRLCFAKRSRYTKCATFCQCFSCGVHNNRICCAAPTEANSYWSISPHQKHGHHGVKSNGL